MISYMVSRLVIQVFGTLYPAYSSYKTVRTKNVKGYVQWMKYWIVFAFLSCVEPFCDFFFGSWMPFYYESKILMVAWLLCPVTRGYNCLYRVFVHPTLIDNEEYIDGLLVKIKEQWRQTVVQLQKRGSSLMMQTVLKGVLSRTTFGSCFQRSNSFADQTYAYGELDERAISYRQHALIRTLFLAENRRNSDPNFFTHLSDSYNKNPRFIQLRDNRGLTNFESVRIVDHQETNLSQTEGDEMKASGQNSEENVSFSLEEFDKRIQCVSPAVNRRLACLARKLSLEGLTNEHIGTVVSTLISDLNPNLSFSSDEAEIFPKADLSDVFMAEDSSQLKNPSQIEEPLSYNAKHGGGNKLEDSEKSSARMIDLKQSRAGRYRKLPAPSPPDSKKISDFDE